MKFALILSLLLISIVAFAAPQPISTQVIELKPGWNLVTITRPLDDANKNIERFLDLHPFMLNKEQKTYVQCLEKDDVKVGVGYWVFAKTAISIELTQDITRTSWDTADVSQSWDLIGQTEKSTWKDKVSSIYKWEDGRFQSVASSEVKVGLAYWTFLDTDK